MDSTTARGFSAAVVTWLQYLAEFRGHSPRTIHAYRLDLRRFGEWAEYYLDRALEPCDIDRTLAVAYVLSLTCGAYAKRRVVASLRGFCEFLVLRGDMAQNPVRGIPLPRLPSPNPKALSEMEFRGMCLVARRRPWQGLLLWLMGGAGLRRAEVASVTTEDMDLRERILTVYGKGRKYRQVPLGEPVLAALEAYLPHRHPRNGSIRLLIDERGVPINRDRVYDTVKWLAEKAGIDPHVVSPHAFRRTFATRLNRQGTDLRTIQELLGHADLSTTARYLEVSPDQKRKAVATLWA